ncbi:MAG: hypothetical protein FJ271_11740 [Planctomycetes bacterium]|nr:hypothetical protein [Planctomycetota bacterium]
MSSGFWGLALVLAWPGDFVERQHTGPATLSMRPDKGPIALSDVLRLRLTVKGSEQLEVQPLASTTMEPSWRLSARRATVNHLARSSIWVQEIEAEPLRPGDLTLELPPLRYREADGRWQVVDWKPIPVKVRTAAVADVKDLRDIADIEKLPAADAGWNDWIGPAAGTLALLVLLALVVTVWRRRRRRRRGPLTPEQMAQRDLDRIAELKLIEAGRAARLHAMLYDVVRRYLRRQYQIAARAHTSAELRAQLQGAPLAAEQRARLDAFLERCERGKFAGAALSAPECLEAAELARQIVSSGTLNSTGQPRENDSPARSADHEGAGS